MTSPCWRAHRKKPDLKSAKLVVGDARDEKTLLQAIKGRVAVVSAPGTPASHSASSPSFDRYALPITAMKAEKVTRLIAFTGIGAGDGSGHGGFLFDRLIYPLILRNVYADKTAMKPLSGPASSTAQSSVLRS
uniref:NAD(P)H-binding protein n=1 Tax=Rhizobium sp. CFBP 8762 TaxID=2775279 RepID=UPI00313AC2A2